MQEKAVRVDPIIAVSALLISATASVASDRIRAAQVSATQPGTSQSTLQVSGEPRKS